jgi:hypothetical protein
MGTDDGDARIDIAMTLTVPGRAGLHAAAAARASA